MARAFSNPIAARQAAEADGVGADEGAIPAQASIAAAVRERRSVFMVEAGYLIVVSGESSGTFAGEAATALQGASVVPEQKNQSTL